MANRWSHHPGKRHLTVSRLMLDSGFRLILDTPWMRELGVAEHRHQAVLAVISDGLSISQVVSKVGVCRRSRGTLIAISPGQTDPLPESEMF